MPALDAGVMAPDFTLPTVDGKQVSLKEALKKGPVLLAFFKVSCPVCQYAFPFFERVFESNRSDNVTRAGSLAGQCQEYPGIHEASTASPFRWRSTMDRMATLFPMPTV